MQLHILAYLFMCLFSKCHLALWKQPCRMENDLLASELRTSASLLCSAAAAEIPTGNNKHQRGCNSVFHSAQDCFHHRIDSRPFCADMLLSCWCHCVFIPVLVCLFVWPCVLLLLCTHDLHLVRPCLSFLPIVSLVSNAAPFSSVRFCSASGSLVIMLMPLCSIKVSAPPPHGRHHHLHLLTGHHPLTSHQAHT